MRYTNYALCCEDSDSDRSMLVMPVQNKDTVHGRPMLLEMKEADTVDAFWMCYVSPWGSDIDDILREREIKSVKCWNVGTAVSRCV